jgi:hypothetical protein
VAKTNDGQEFYLVDARPRSDDVDPDTIEEVLRLAVRAGDGVFRWRGRVMAAIAGSVTGAGAATRRLMKLTKEQGIATKIILVPEPFMEELRDAAAEVIVGSVNVRPRSEAESKPDSVQWEG